MIDESTKDYDMFRLAAINVVNSAIMRKSNPPTKVQRDTAGLIDQILMNQHYIMLMLLHAQGVDTIALRDQCNNLQRDDEGRYTT